uniref:ENT domain-containing protein n=1 Tax=Panagrolaimus sp. PS1159 TaxID=55785 RepID=A0AC35GEN4_9BILA
MDFAETSSALNNGETITFSRSIEELKKPGRKKHVPTSSRFTEPSSSSSYFEGNKIYNFDVEDSALILRQMELEALKNVATAFRCQGPLTPYKELILEHLKFALFIREHDFIQIIQEIADDTFLQKTCKTLNKSSSCSAQWRALSFPAHTPTNAYIRKPGLNESRINLMTTIGCHNVSVKELDVATAKLSALKKEQYIPQQLRRVLADSELSAGRVDIEPFDITEEEMRRDFVDYEKEKDRIAKEIEEEEKGRNHRSRRGKKRKVTIPRFQNHTLRAQARAATKEEEINEKKKKSNDDVPDEEEQIQAEQEMMKMIEEQAKAPTIPTPVIVETKKILPPSPQKIVQKAKGKRKSKDAFNHSKEVKQSPQQRHQLAPFVMVPEHLPPPKPLIITPKPQAPTPTEHFHHPPPKHNRSEEQRAMDEDLVLVKTAQAMIEDLENTAEPENGLTPGKRRKQKHDGTPKRRGRKPAESKDNPITCARIAPFKFEGNSNDPNKPPRGNPDKKLKKQVNDSKPAPPVTNGVYDKPVPSPPASQPRLPVIPTSTGTPKTAIIPVSSATIVIRPRNPSTATSPSTSIANVANEISPPKRMRFSSETSSSQTTVVSGPIQTDPNRVFPVIRQMFIFRNVLNNGTPRFTVPFTTQASGNPTRPYYGNPSFNNRAAVSRDRPQLHTFTRPTTSVIRLVTNDNKAEEIQPGSVNGMRSRSTEEITVTKKEGEPLINGITHDSVAQTPLTSMSQNTSVANIQFSTSFPPITTTTETAAQMISLRPHFPLSTNIQSPQTMINLQTVTYSTKPTSSLYQVVNATPTFMQNMSSTQVVQTAIPVMLHTVSTSNFTTNQPILNVPIRQPTFSISKPIKEKIHKSNGNQNINDIPLPEADDSIDMNSSYSSNESFEIPPPPPPPPENEGQSSSIPETATVPPEDPSHQLSESQHQNYLNSESTIPQPEVVINGVDHHISASHQSIVNTNSYQQHLFSVAPISSSSSSISPPPSNSDDANSSSTNLLPVEESQILNVSQTAPTTTTNT